MVVLLNNSSENHDTFFSGHFDKSWSSKEQHLFKLEFYYSLLNESINLFHFKNLTNPNCLNGSVCV